MKAHDRHLGWLGFLLAATFWLLETAIHTWVFRSGTVSQNFFPHDPNEVWMRFVAMGMLVAFGLYAQANAVAIRKAEARTRAIQARLDDLLTRLLGHHVPICAKCKAIRNNDTWVRIEEYVTQHTGARFSHGLCATCLTHAQSELRVHRQEHCSAAR